MMCMVIAHDGPYAEKRAEPPQILLFGPALSKDGLFT